MNKVVSKQVTNILKNLFFFLILFTISSSCDAILMLPYVIKNKTQDTLTIHAPADPGIFSMRNADSVYHLAPNQNLLVGWNRGIGFPWETRKLYKESPSIWNFEIENKGETIPFLKNDEEWHYKRGTSVYKIKPLK
jgi:hypothetical protein